MMDDDLAMVDIFSQPDSCFIVSESQPDAEPSERNTIFSHLKALNESQTVIKNIGSSLLCEDAPELRTRVFGTGTFDDVKSEKGRSAMMGGNGGGGGNHQDSSGAHLVEKKAGNGNSGNHGSGSQGGGNNGSGSSGAGGDGGDGNNDNNGDDDNDDDEDEEEEHHDESTPSSGQSSGSMPPLVPPGGTGSSAVQQVSFHPIGGGGNVAASFAVESNNSNGHNADSDGGGGLSDAPTAVVSDSESQPVQPWLRSPGAGTPVNAGVSGLIGSPRGASRSPRRSGAMTESPRGELSSPLSTLSSFTSSSSDGGAKTKPQPTLSSRKRPASRRIAAPRSKKVRIETSSETDTTTDRTTSTTTTTTTTDTTTTDTEVGSQKTSHDRSPDERGMSHDSGGGEGDQTGEKPLRTDEPPASQHDMFADKDDDFGSTPSETVGSLTLSAQPMLVPGALEGESLGIIPPSQSSCDGVPHIVPSSPTVCEDNKQSSSRSSSLKPASVPFQEWQPSYAGNSEVSRTSSVSTVAGRKSSSEGSNDVKVSDKRVKRRQLASFDEPPQTEDFLADTRSRPDDGEAGSTSQSLHLQFSNTELTAEGDVTTEGRHPASSGRSQSQGTSSAGLQKSKQHTAVVHRKEDDATLSSEASVQFVGEGHPKSDVPEVIDVIDDSSQSLALQMTLTQSTLMSQTQGQDVQLKGLVSQLDVASQNAEKLHSQVNNSKSSQVDRPSFCLSVPRDSELQTMTGNQEGKATQNTASNQASQSRSQDTASVAERIPPLTLNMIHSEPDNTAKPALAFQLDKPTLESQCIDTQASEENVFRKVKDLKELKMIDKAVSGLQDDKSMEAVNSATFPEEDIPDVASVGSRPSKNVRPHHVAASLEMRQTEDSEIVVIRRKPRPITEENSEPITQDIIIGGESLKSHTSTPDSQTQGYKVPQQSSDKKVDDVNKIGKQVHDEKIMATRTPKNTPSSSNVPLQPLQTTPKSTQSKKRVRPKKQNTTSQPVKSSSHKGKTSERDVCSEPGKFDFTSQSQEDREALHAVLGLGKEARARVAKGSEKSDGQRSQKTTSRQSSSSSSRGSTRRQSSGRSNISRGMSGDGPSGQKSSGGSSGSRGPGVHILRITTVRTTSMHTMKIVEERVDGNIIRTDVTEDKVETLDRSVNVTEEILSPMSPSRSLQTTMTTGDFADISCISDTSSKPGSSFNSPHDNTGMLQQNTHLLIAQLQRGGTLQGGHVSSSSSTYTSPPSQNTSVSDSQCLTPLIKAPPTSKTRDKTDGMKNADKAKMPPPALPTAQSPSKPSPPSRADTAPVNGAGNDVQSVGTSGPASLKQKSSTGTSTMHSESLFSTTTESAAAATDVQKTLSRVSSESYKQSASLFSNSESDKGSLDKSAGNDEVSFEEKLEKPLGTTESQSTDSETIIPGTDSRENEISMKYKNLTSLTVHASKSNATDDDDVVMTTANDDENNPDADQSRPKAPADTVNTNNTPPAVQVAVPYLPDDSTLEKGTAVMAMWKDKHYYPAYIWAKKGQRYQVMFEDKNKFVVKVENIIVCEVFPVGQEVLVENDSTWCVPGRVVAHLRDETADNQVGIGYLIEVDNKQRIRVSRDKVSLSSSQATNLLNAIQQGTVGEVHSNSQVQNTPQNNCEEVHDLTNGHDSKTETERRPETPSEDVEMVYIPDDPFVPTRPVPVGTLVLALWKDKHLYPGKVVDTDCGGKWKIAYDDGTEELVHSFSVVICELLPVNSSVMAVREIGGWSQPATVLSHFCKTVPSGKKYGYIVKFSDGAQRTLPRESVTLRPEQATALFSKLQTHLGTPMQSGMAKVSLENLVEGKRRRARLDSAGKSPVPAVPDDSKSEKTKSIKRKKLPSAAATSTPKRQIIADDNDPQTPLTTPFSSPPVVRRSPRAARSNLFSNTKGQIPRKGSQLFKDIVFLLTHVEKTQEQKREERKLLWQHKSNISMETSEEDAMFSEEEEVPFDKDHIFAQLNGGGGTVLDHFDLDKLKEGKACFLISDTFQRTLKYFYCLAANIVCLSHLWVRDCCNTNEIQDYKNYLLPAGINLQSGQLIEWHERGGVLNGLAVCVLSTNPKFVNAWRSVLQVAGCQLVLTLSDSGEKIDLLVTDQYICDDDIKSAQNLDVPIVTSEWVIQCLITGKRMAYNGHPQFSVDNVENLKN